MITFSQISSNKPYQIVSNESTTSSTEDPFASQREEDKTIDSIAGDDDMAMPESGSPDDTRRMSREWDASKVSD